MRFPFVSQILKIFILPTIVGLCGIPATVFSASSGGQTAASFLQIGLGARAAGMGGAYTSVAGGATAAYWNPASLGTIEEGGEVILGHYAWYQDITVEQGAVAYRMNDQLTSALSITFLDYGRIEGFDADGNATGDLSAYDLAIAVSAGYEANEKASFGLTGKIVNQKLDDINAATFALDLGVHYQGDRYALAGVLTNLGGKMKFGPIEEDLPTSARLGGSLFLLNDRLSSSLDLEKGFQGGTVVRQGVEFNHNQQYFLRAGYNFYPGEDNRQFSTGMTFGAGLRLNQIAFDYAFTLKERYAADNLHRFSLIFSFTGN